jgi:hypothetical protein
LNKSRPRQSICLALKTTLKNISVKYQKYYSFFG